MSFGTRGFESHPQRSSLGFCRHRFIDEPQSGCRKGLMPKEYCNNDIAPTASVSTISPGGHRRMVIQTNAYGQTVPIMNLERHISNAASGLRPYFRSMLM